VFGALLVLAPEHHGLPLAGAAVEHGRLARFAQLHALKDSAALRRTAGQQGVGGNDDLVGGERVERMRDGDAAAHLLLRAGRATYSRTLWLSIASQYFGS